MIPEGDPLNFHKYGQKKSQYFLLRSAYTVLHTRTGTRRLRLEKVLVALQVSRCVHNYIHTTQTRQG